MLHDKFNTTLNYRTVNRLRRDAFSNSHISTLWSSEPMADEMRKTDGVQATELKLKLKTNIGVSEGMKTPG